MVVSDDGIMRERSAEKPFAFRGEVKEKAAGWLYIYFTSKTKWFLG